MRDRHYRCYYYLTDRLTDINRRVNLLTHHYLASRHVRARARKEAFAGGGGETAKNAERHTIRQDTRLVNFYLHARIISFNTYIVVYPRESERAFALSLLRQSRMRSCKTSESTDSLS